uniref:Uncharacterized protein n=1 Tax=Anguilla anguilla TaxID=7936 RepID=A0A0E9WEV3_ANGAN
MTDIHTELRWVIGNLPMAIRTSVERTNQNVYFSCLHVCLTTPTVKGTSLVFALCQPILDNEQTCPSSASALQMRVNMGGQFYIHLQFKSH